MVLTVIYWVVWVLLLIAVFGPSEFIPRGPVHGIIEIVLFAVIGLKVFRQSLRD